MKPKSSIPISSSNLYHFTSSIDNLTSILRSGFEYRTIKEALPLTGFKDDPISYPGIVRHIYEWPVICFCDLPEHAIEDHSNQYGAFGICLKKSWGVKNGVTPIRYIHYHTPDFDNDMFFTIEGLLHNLPSVRWRFSSLIASVLNANKIIDPITSSEWEALPEKFKVLIKQMDIELNPVLYHTRRFLGLVRAYEGEWKDKVTGIEGIRRFYDEKEWRSLKVESEQGNLMFDSDDIEFVIIRSRSEISELKRMLSESESHVKFEEIKSKIIRLDEITGPRKSSFWARIVNAFHAINRPRRRSAI